MLLPYSNRSAAAEAPLLTPGFQNKGSSQRPVQKIFEFPQESSDNIKPEIAKPHQAPSYRLYTRNFFCYMMTQMAISVFAVTAYAICTLAMSHNVCRYDKSYYPETSQDDLHDNPDHYPNVTTPMQLSFIFGLLIHVGLFVVDIFLEPSLRFLVRPKANQNVNDPLAADIIDDKKIQEKKQAQIG